MNIGKIIFVSSLSVVYLCLGLAFTWPLASSFTEKVPNNIVASPQSREWGDHLQIIAGFREHCSAIRSVLTGQPVYQKEFCLGKVQKASSWYIFRNIVFSPYWVHTVINLLFSPSDTTLYNVVVIISFVLTGLIAFLLAFEFIPLTLRQSAGWLAPGIAFLTSMFVVLFPARIHHLLVGHRNGWMIGLFVLLVFLLERALRISGQDNYRSTKYFTASAFTLIFLAFTELFLLLFGWIYVTARIIWYEFIERLPETGVDEQPSIKSRLPGYLLLSAAFGIIFFVVLTENVVRVRPYQAIQYFTPQVSNLFVNNAVEPEYNIFLGTGLVVLFLAAIIWLKKILYIQRNGIDSVFLKLTFFLAMAGLMLLLTLGDHTPFYRFAYDRVPFLQYSRTPARCILLVSPLLAIITCITVSMVVPWISARIGVKGVKGLLILLALITAVSFHPWQAISLTHLPDIPRYASENGKVLFLPFAAGDHQFNSIYEYAISYSSAVMINGYRPFVSSEYDDFSKLYRCKLNSGMFDNTTFKEFLIRFQIRRIIVLEQYFNCHELELSCDGESLPDLEKVKAMLKSAGLEKRWQQEGMDAYMAE